MRIASARNTGIKSDMTITNQMRPRRNEIRPNSKMTYSCRDYNSYKNKFIKVMTSYLEIYLKVGSNPNLFVHLEILTRLTNLSIRNLSTYICLYLSRNLTLSNRLITQLEISTCSRVYPIEMFSHMGVHSVALGNSLTERYKDKRSVRTFNVLE